MRKIIKLFEQGNVCVCGLRGKGKDMLTANVVVRRNKPYVSNTTYFPAKHFQFIPQMFDCGKNTYVNFIENRIKPYIYPFADGTDIYISDAGVYFPSQYCNLLNRDYGYFSTFMALSRHLGDCNVHFNVQNLNRVWDKIREQSDTYIMCKRCFVFFGKIVLQSVIIYEKYQSCVDRVPPYRISCPWFNPDRIQRWKIDRQSYEIAHGRVKVRWLLYCNKSNYNTRIFKELMEGEKNCIEI